MGVYALLAGIVKVASTLLEKTQNSNNRISPVIYMLDDVMIRLAFCDRPPYAVFEGVQGVARRGDRHRSGA
jgi:hypothetical protein